MPTHRAIAAVTALALIGADTAPAMAQEVWDWQAVTVQTDPCGEYHGCMNYGPWPPRPARKAGMEGPAEVAKATRGQSGSARPVAAETETEIVR